jgi:hypothetical protein
MDAMPRPGMLFSGLQGTAFQTSTPIDGLPIAVGVQCWA